MDIIEVICGEAAQAQAQEMERRREADDLSAYAVSGGFGQSGFTAARLLQSLWTNHSRKASALLTSVSGVTSPYRQKIGGNISHAWTWRLGILRWPDTTV
jgi:hypothetical protein